jgi:hypothetical protein
VRFLRCFSLALLISPNLETSYYLRVGLSRRRVLLLDWEQRESPEVLENCIQRFRKDIWDLEAVRAHAFQRNGVSHPVPVR